MRSPSARLLELLQRLDLCDRGDLRACHGQVRRLARDLPAFDSVWVDALVQRRRLTPFQAELLLSEQPERLNAGPCVLVARLGHHESARTFLARRRDTREQCVVKFVGSPPETRNAVGEGLAELATAMQQVRHDSIAGPHASLEYEGRLVAVSRFVPGGCLKDTLIQTGRLTASDVREIGGQILAGLAEMERHWPAHGDIRIANLRLAVDGTACLTNCGVSVAARRRFVVHQRLRADRCDNVAPELIGTDRNPDAQTDLYALGCVLWQLLCGRPPFSCADPLDKLAAHQTLDIPDVREIAPDTPAWMAEAIDSMTRRSRPERPASFGDAARRWLQRSGRTDSASNALSRFSPRVREIARRTSPPARAARWIIAGTLLLSIAGAGLIATQGGRARELLSLSTGNTPQPTHAATGDAEPAVPTLPQPDSAGLIALPHAGPWRARDIPSPGDITIRGTGSEPARIVCDEPWIVEGNRLTLENVELSGMADSLLRCTSRVMRVARCSFRSPDNSIVWRSPDERDRSGRKLTITDTIFHGPGDAIRLLSAATDVNLGNVLVLQSESAVHLAEPVSAGENTTVRLIRVTTRHARCVARCTLPDGPRAHGHIDVVYENCVFALEQRGAAFAIRSPHPHRSATPLLEARARTGEDASLVSSGSMLSVWENPLTGVAIEPTGDTLLVADLIASPLTFRGNQLNDASGSELVDFEAPRLSTVTPGVNATALPRTHHE